MKKLSFGTWLIILTAMVNVPRWVGVYTFGQFVFLDFISGIAMGLSIAAGIAFTFHRVGKMQAFTPKGKPVMRFWIGMVTGVLILGISIYLLPPYILATMPENFKANIPNPKVWAAVSVLTADLLIVMLAAVDGKAAGFTEGGKEPRTAGRQGGKAAGGKGGKLPVGGKAAGGKATKVATPAITGKVVSDQQIQDYFMKNPTASIRQAAKDLGISHQALGPRVKAMYAAPQPAKKP